MAKGDGGRTSGGAESPRPNVSGGRETVESFVVVFLFFLVLGVEAEGFVIPTGSMAPTLLGRQKEVTCPQCSEVYEVNADGEVNEDAPSFAGSRQVVAGSCVNCRFPSLIAEEPSFQGDRIYVMKTPLDVPFVPALGKSELERWCVAVFKLPEAPDVRYIKRLVGMPDEVLRIQQGDVWVRPRGPEVPFVRAPRPLLHQEAMQLPVHNDAHRAKALGPEWNRWGARPPGAWVESPSGTYRTREVASTMALIPEAIKSGPVPAEGWAELVYRNLVPTPDQWAAVAKRQPLPFPPRPTLITDYYSYNTETSAASVAHPEAASKAWRQPHWVGDLTLHLDLDIAEARGAIRLELVKAGVVNRCQIDLANGLATLWHGDQRIAGPSPTGVASPGRHALSFANVDDRLTLRVDGRLPFGEGVSFDPNGSFAPTVEDLSPARVSAKGAPVSVGRLRITRDIYYSQEPSRADLDLVDIPDPLPRDPAGFFDWLADPSRFSAFGQRPSREFEIAPGHYMMLGDNSPWSRDGRAWERTDQRDAGEDPSRGWDESGRESWEVPESLMIGKAFCVYWPHMKPFGPAWRFGPNVRLPARPYLEKARWVR